MKREERREREERRGEDGEEGGGREGREGRRREKKERIERWLVRAIHACLHVTTHMYVEERGEEEKRRDRKNG
jgi:hypothetical protein